MALLRHGPPHAHWLVIFLEDGPMVAAVGALGADTAVVEVGRVRDVGKVVPVIRRLTAIARGWRADVAVGWMTKAHLYTAPMAATLGIPALWFQHGTPGRTDPIDRLATLLPARFVLAPSKTVAAAQAALWPRRDVRVAYPGVELPPADRTANAELLRSLGIPAGAPVVGLVARLQRWKGVHVLVEAFPAVLERHPAAHAVVVGGDHALEPGYRQELLALADRLGIADRVHLAGYQAGAQRWIDSFDVVVHASDNEPFGLVPLEAMALGKPLVAGAAGGPSEVLRDGVDGFLVPFGDAAGLAARIDSYLGDPELASRIGRAAAERAGEFTVERFVAVVVAALEDARSGDARAGEGVGS
jgi:glycosyltransferase involved in cell wall biosynthesis